MRPNEDVARVSATMLKKALSLKRPEPAATRVIESCADTAVDEQKTVKNMMVIIAVILKKQNDDAECC